MVASADYRATLDDHATWQDYLCANKYKLLQNVVNNILAKAGDGLKAETVKILSRTLSYHISNFCEAKQI